MRGFLIDENLPAAVAEELIARGFDAEAVADNPAIRSAADADLVVYAQRRELIIVSRDKDFADLSKYPFGSHSGVVCVRLPNRMAIDAQVDIVVTAIASLKPEELAGNIVVIEPGQMRMRRRRL